MLSNRWGRGGKRRASGTRPKTRGAFCFRRALDTGLPCGLGLGYGSGPPCPRSILGVSALLGADRPLQRWPVTWP